MLFTCQQSSGFIQKLTSGVQKPSYLGCIWSGRHSEQSIIDITNVFAVVKVTLTSAIHHFLKISSEQEGFTGNMLREFCRTEKEHDESGLTAPTIIFGFFTIHIRSAPPIVPFQILLSPPADSHPRRSVNS